MPIPAGLSESDFSDALRELRAVVGEDWVFADEPNLQTYRDDFSPLRGGPDEPIPSAAVAPDNVEEVRQVVRIANQYAIPVWVISTGKNFGYGGPESRTPGTLVIDLKRMNRIIEVNERLAYAIVEPGVSQYDLWRHMQAQGIKLWIDGPSPAWSSLVAHTIERGVGYGLAGDRVAQICGMEVVLPNGELLRTGMAAMDNPACWANYKYGLGPVVDGLFSQTSLGIVTRIGVWLIPQPEVMRPASIMVPRHEDIVPMLNLMTDLRLKGVIDNAASGAMIRPSFVPPGEMPPGPPQPEREWVFRVGYYGTEKMVAAAWEHTRDVFGDTIQGTKFYSELFKAPYDPETMDTRAKLAAGIPSFAEENFWPHSMTFCSVVLPAGGEEYWRFISVFDEVYRRYGKRFRGGNIHLHVPRATVTVQGIPIERDNADENAQTIEMVRELISVAGENGWGEYRTPPLFMDEAAEQYGFNDHALRRFNEDLKDMLDPNGIFSPGKNGIWPKHIREAGS